MARAIPYVAVLVGIYGLGSGWAAILLYHVGALIALRRGDTTSLRSAARSGWRAGPIVASSLIGAGGGVLLYLLWPFVEREGATLAQRVGDLGLGGASWWLFVIYFASVHPVVEELLWRVYLGSRIKRVTLTDFAFAGYHVLVLVMFLDPIWVVLCFTVLAAASWALRLLCARYEGLGVAIASHAVADAGIVAGATLVMSATQVGK